MHCFQIIKVWHELTQGLWLAEGLMIKALPEDVEDASSNPAWFRPGMQTPHLSCPEQTLRVLLWKASPSFI